MKSKMIVNRGAEHRKLIVLIAIISVTVALLESCGGIFTIKEDQRLPLIEDQARSGVYKTVDFELTYSYTYRPGTSGASATIDLSGSVARKSRLNSMGINLNFLDTGGKIISSKLVYAYIFKNKGKHGDSSFEDKLEIPPGTASIAFTSNARKRESHG